MRAMPDGQGTPEENKETADGTITYFGTYAVADAESSIAIHVEGSSFPNWNGTDQKRFVGIEWGPAYTDCSSTR